VAGGGCGGLYCVGGGRLVALDVDDDCLLTCFCVIDLRGSDSSLCSSGRVVNCGLCISSLYFVAVRMLPVMMA
jgi:hypothetical protein